MYPEQVKQIQFITPSAESGINESLVAETSERVFLVNFRIPDNRKILDKVLFQTIMFNLFPEQVKKIFRSNISFEKK